MWEAQFGDFANGGQVVIDQYITTGEDKWGQRSGLVMLLPHGYEGQGPEHSSARIERYLTLAANGNIQVAQPTNAAQYFHLLRRQGHRSIKKPLIVFTPKSLLRSPAATSKTMDLEVGHFFETIDDPYVEDRGAVKKVVLVSGKIAFTLFKLREEQKRKDVAVIRLEQLYPFPEEQLNEIYDSYPNAREVRWIQEEPENMGPWAFVHAKMHAHLPDKLRLHHVCRAESPSPAAGSKTIHGFENDDLMRRAFAEFI
jgi:2-oxoglutarate dehydrogenase E1 component